MRNEEIGERQNLTKSNTKIKMDTVRMCDDRCDKTICEAAMGEKKARIHGTQPLLLTEKRQNQITTTLVKFSHQSSNNE